MYQWIGEMTIFLGTEGTYGTGNCDLSLGHGCRALSNILSIPRCEDFVNADCRLNIMTTIVEALEYMPEWDVHDLEDVGQTILHCSMGVPTLPFQRALVALWEQNQRTLAWTFRWTQWLASLLDKGLWTTALVVECNGIENLVLLNKTWRSNITIVTVVLHILTRLNTDMRTLLGQKDAMAILESVPLSAVDEDNRLTILARVPPRQEGAPDDHV